MTSSPANWTNLFHPRQGSLDAVVNEVEIFIEDDEVTEVTADMMVAMPSLEDDPMEAYEDVTDSLEPIDEELATQDMDSWPRSFEEHLSAVRRTQRKGVTDDVLALFGLTNAAGCEETAAAIAKAWEDLDFWEPMLEMGSRGEFTGHLQDLRKCAALLEAHPPPLERADLLELWKEARDALRLTMPGLQAAAASDMAWQQNVARGRSARISVVREDVA
jgi:hypothetical protein